MPTPNISKSFMRGFLEGLSMTVNFGRSAEADRMLHYLMNCKSASAEFLKTYPQPLVTPTPNTKKTPAED